MIDQINKLQHIQYIEPTGSALDAKVSFDIGEFLIRNRIHDGDDWTEFYDGLMLSVLTSGAINWSDCPDDAFRLIWKHKQSMLHDLYNAIHNVYSCYVPNIYFADLYREKTEQALDVLDGSCVHSDSVPLLIPPNIQDQADLILSQRSNWIRILKLLEDYRSVGKLGIIKASTIANADTTLRTILSELVEEVR